MPGVSKVEVAEKVSVTAGPEGTKSSRSSLRKL